MDVASLRELYGNLVAIVGNNHNHNDDNDGDDEDSNNNNNNEDIANTLM